MPKQSKSDPWRNAPDFDDDCEPSGHTLITDAQYNPILVTCAGTKPSDLALATAAPLLRDALKLWAWFAANNGWTDQDFHDGDPSVNGWITKTQQALAAAEGRTR